MCKTFLKIWSFDRFSVNDIKAEISCWYLLYLSDWFKWTIVVLLRYCDFLFCTADLGQAGPNFVLGTKPNVWTIENPLQIENQPFFFKDPLQIEPSHPNQTNYRSKTRAKESVGGPNVPKILALPKFGWPPAPSPPPPPPLPPLPLLNTTGGCGEVRWADLDPHGNTMQDGPC